MQHWLSFLLCPCCGQVAELLWNIVPPSQLNGEGGYYLSQLTTALQVLLTMDLGVVGPGAVVTV